MNTRNCIGIVFGLSAGVFLSAGVGATGKHPSDCNHDLDQTGAQFVTYDKAAAYLSCKNIVGRFGKMHPIDVDEDCGKSGCSVVAEEETMPFDAVVVGTRNLSCVYMFSDAVKAESLKGPRNHIRFACSDGDTSDDGSVSDEPITSIDGGCAADEDFDGIQAAVAQQDGVDWVFGVGDNEKENDKTGLCVQGGADEIARCDEQCIVPKDSTEFPYRSDDPICMSGELDYQTGKVTFPLKCRPCALTEEVTPTAGAKSYCWERANRRAYVADETSNELTFRDFFIRTAVKSSGSLVYTQYEGSTCYEIKTTYRGVQRTYWTPSGCP